jgi:N-acetylneuraminic acid mutarotase
MFEPLSTSVDLVFEAAATAIGSTIHVSGGKDKDGFLSTSAFLHSRGDRPQLTRPLPEPRARHAAAASDGKYYIVGGITDNPDLGLSLASEVLQYDSKSDRWDAISQLPRRASQLAAECVKGKLIVIAGDTGTTTQPGHPIAPARCRGDVQILDLVSGRWTYGNPKPTPETGVTSAVLGSEIFVCSSYDSKGIVSAIVEVYNVRTNTWRSIPNMPTARTGVPCAFVAGKLWCVNGQGANLKPIAVVEIYDPKSNSWTSLTKGPKAAIGQAYAGIESQLVLIGGLE